MSIPYSPRNVNARRSRLRREFLAEWMILLEVVCRVEAAHGRLPVGTFTPSEDATICVSLDRVWSELINERPKLDRDDTGEMVLRPASGVHPVTAAVLKRLGRGKL